MHQKFIREPVVVEMTGLSRATIWRMVGQKTFPSPVKLGPHSTAWIEAEVQGWMAERIAASRAPAPQEAA